MLSVDGSRGEGGGQILRSSLSLSLATGTPVRVHDIRAGRPRPGLRHQHLAAVRAAASVGDADVDGAETGSRTLSFSPRGLRAGEHVVDVGTAGSATLVAQTVALPLLAADAPSSVVVHGGTHNPAAPPADFLEDVLFAVLRSAGARVRARTGRVGFAPAGGGHLTVDVEPSELGRVELNERGALKGHRARALLSDLPDDVAERELDVVRERLGWQDTLRERVEADGPGNALLLETRCKHVTEITTAFGRSGLPAERVAETAVQEHATWWESGAPVGPHLADQLLLPLALHAGGDFTSTEPTPHFTTNAAVIAQMTPAEVTTRRLDDQRVRVAVDT